MFHRKLHRLQELVGERFARHEPDDEDRGHGGFFGHHRRRGLFMRGGGRGLGRFFAHGDLKLVVLGLISEKPRHGYEIIKAIEDRVSGAYSPSPGVIYPTLTFLEEMGYVKIDADGAKKLYAVTPEGQSYLDANRKSLDALLARMDEAGRAHGSGEAPQVVRAKENLKLALKLKLSRGPLTDDQIAAVATALDAAAAAIERA